MPCQCANDTETVSDGCQCGTSAQAGCQCAGCAPSPELDLERIVKDLGERVRALEASR